MDRANGLFPDCHPGHRLADVGAAPDHAVLAEGLSQAVGVVDVRRPLTPVLVEVGPGAGLNCPVCGKHLFSSVSTILGPRGPKRHPR